MKTRIFVVAAVLAVLITSAPLMAQKANTDVTQKKADINELLDKRCNRMSNQLKLDETTAAKFTPLYKEYLKEIRACRPAPCNKADRKQYTEAEKKARLANGFEYREKVLETQKRYFKEFEKFLNAKQLHKVFFSDHPSKQKYNKAGKHNGKCNHNTNKRNTCNKHCNTK